MIGYNIILYISDGASGSNSVLAALEEKGYEVVSTNRPTEGVALLYVMHSAAAVVVDKDASEQAGFDLVQSPAPHSPEGSCNAAVRWPD